MALAKPTQFFNLEISTQQYQSLVSPAARCEVGGGIQFQIDTNKG